MNLTDQVLQMLNWWAIWIQILIILNATTAQASTISADGCEAHLNRHAYQFFALENAAIYGSRGGPLLTTNKGDTFLSLGHGGSTSLYDFQKNRLTAFETGNFEETSDLFESRSGRVYFGYVTTTHVKVVDARSLKTLLDVPLSKIDRLSDLLTQASTPAPMFRPLFFENSEGVQVAIVPLSDELYLDEAFLVPLVTLNVRTGEERADEVHSGIIRYERMPNGHVYGMGWEREMGGYPNTLLVHDLNAHKTLLREKFAHTQDPPIIAGQLSLFLENPRSPRLVMFLQSPAGKASIYSREERQFNPIPGLSRALTTSIRFFNDESGKPWFAAIEGNESASLAPEYYRLVIQPMAGLSGALVQDLDLAHMENEITGLEVIERAEGRLFLAWERTTLEGKTRYARVHIYDQAKKKMTIVDIPSEWPGVSRRKSFWNPAKHALFTYFVRADDTSPEFAQLYGPPVSEVSTTPPSASPPPIPRF